METFKIEIDRVIRASAVIGRVDDQGRPNGDLSDCRSLDVKHLVELLANILVLERIDPGITMEILELLPQRLKSRKQADQTHLAQKHQAAYDAWTRNEFEKMGLGDEYRDVMAAHRHPKQKDYIANVIAFNMKLHGMDQDQCIQAFARQSGKSIVSLRKAMTRYKSRIKT
jgi:hypothetical protein